MTVQCRDSLPEPEVHWWLIKISKIKIATYTKNENKTVFEHPLNRFNSRKKLIAISEFFCDDTLPYSDGFDHRFDSVHNYNYNG